MSRTLLSILLLFILLAEAVFVAVMVGMAAGWNAAVAAGAAAVAVPILIINIMARLISRTGTIGKLCKAYPLREGVFDPSKGPAILSSISIVNKWVSINGCVRLASDDDSFHLLIEMPLAPTSSGASVPWEAFEVVRKDGSLAALRLFDGGKLWVPWRFAKAEAELREGLE